MSIAHDRTEVERFEALIDAWLQRGLAENPLFLAVDRAQPDEIALGERRWYVRLRGEEKDYTTVWLTLGQRTLRYETYMMPAPEENHEQLYEQLMRRNDRLVGAHFSIGAEDGIFLRGDLPLAAVDDDELDRIIGSLYASVEQCFQASLRIGFASRF